MAIERTFGMIIADAVEKAGVGGVLEMLEKGGLRIVGLRMTRLSRPRRKASTRSTSNALFSMIW